MTEPIKLSFDGKVNLPMLVAVIAAVSSGAVYVNSKFDTLGRLVIDTAADRARIDQLEAQILQNRAETLENRRINKQILEKLS